jgi:hypothetical protein
MRGVHLSARWLKVLLVTAGAGALVGYDFVERHLLRQPVDLWRASIPVDTLIFAFWPALNERIERMRKRHLVAAAIAGGAGALAIQVAESVGLLPFVPPPIAAAVFGSSALLAGAAIIAHTKAVDWRNKLLVAAAALSQVAFAAGELFVLHRPELGWGFVVACAAGAVAAIADLVVRAPNREQRRHERQLTRVRSVPQER